jgi:hypothetical protein
MKNINKIKKLVKQECSCYFQENNYCCKHDKTCMFFWDSDVIFDKNNFEHYKCKYFETSVLPLDAQLELEYKQENHIDFKDLKKCDRCEKPFKPNSNRQKYCDYCKDFMIREKARKYDQKKRLKTLPLDI